MGEGKNNKNKIHLQELFPLKWLSEFDLNTYFANQALTLQY